MQLRLVYEDTTIVGIRRNNQGWYTKLKTMLVYQSKIKVGTEMQLSLVYQDETNVVIPRLYNQCCITKVGIQTYSRGW